jgi:hypothetical protein
MKRRINRKKMKNLQKLLLADSTIGYTVNDAPGIYAGAWLLGVQSEGEAKGV